MGGTDCSAADSSNQGCGMRSPANNSFGTGFNNIGGGVYASALVLCDIKRTADVFLHSAMGQFGHCGVSLPEGHCTF